MSIDTAFVGIENVNSTERLPQFKEGTYVLETEALKYVPNTRHGALSLGEFKILESTEGGSTVGTSAAWKIFMSRDSAKANVRNMVAGVMGLEEAKIDAKACQEVFSPANPTAGLKVRAKASTITTKKGEPFTVVRFYPYEVTSATPAPAAGTTTSTKGKVK